MKKALLLTAMSVAAMMAAAPARAECSHCVVQTKTPSASQPGKFEYRVSCIIDISGDEANTVVTAASDDEAMEMVRKAHC